MNNINSKSKTVKIITTALMLMTFNVSVHAQLFNGLFKTDKIEKAKARRTQVEREDSDIINRQPSRTVNQAVKREKRAEAQDADVIEVNDDMNNANPYWVR